MIARAGRGRIGRLLAALGPLSPLATASTFSPGARRLLEEAERSADIALHLVRALMWALLFPIGLIAWSFPPWLIGIGMVVATLMWSGSLWLLLRHRRAWMTYALITLDVYLLTESAVASRGPLADLYTAAGTLFGIAPRPAELMLVVPPLFVYVALSGAIRVDPFKSAYATVLCVLGYAFFASTIEVPAGEAAIVGATILVAGLVGIDGARVVRYVVLKARQQAVMESYVPEALTATLARTGSLERAARTERVTLFLSDIRGFTRYSERRPPEDSVRLLDGYLEIVTSALAAHGGVVDKYIGDGVLAFFEGEAHERRAVAAAREALRGVGARNAAAGDPLRIGIALHTGVVLLGTIGSATRRDYTVISDAVNLTARLEELNKVLGTELVMSEATGLALDEAERGAFTGPRVVEVRDLPPARVYALVDRSFTAGSPRTA